MDSSLSSEQCGHAVGDQLQREATHGDQRGEEAPGLPGRAAESPHPDGEGAHGQMGGEERHRQHHSSAGRSLSVKLFLSLQPRVDSQFGF